ncbi:MULTISPECIES: aldo/keto reductase [Vibrio]|uniref:aldo/keto reductase n=1 Tax=Vibrio TaxID=662 RepID=UPI0001540E7D|nr:MULTISPECIES: aldo/keto reductase [Vibrio]EDL54910.1 Aldehyde reductase [Vibrio mediterranei AK1]KFA95433.1 aldehyde oxidoreductase [Vibrio sp. ER1A]MCF4176248.1 aldo/keto reductase [Vibrio sp. McD22-P3]USE02664.1 aldo/keto reductase [Vibrio sp. SCSIO 43133]
MTVAYSYQPTVDIDKVPTKTLYTGQKMPAVGLGTFGSDRFGPEEVSQAVYGAIKAGYRFLDCASIYGNEDQIGDVLKRAMNDFGIEREEFFINSKVWNDQHDDVINACKKTLKDLQVDYLDLYMVHWPFPNFHPIGCDGDSRSPDAKPYIHEDFMKTWRQMEQLVEMGLVKAIGTSNMTIAKMALLIRDARIKPAVNEMECHPLFQQEELYNYMINNDVVPVGFCPIGSPTRPERDKTAEDLVDIENPVIVAAAERLGVHPAIVCIKWAVQRGHVPIPFSVAEDQYVSNLKCVTENPLTAEELEAISRIDANNRLIKGQVFLWEGADSWEQLWDLDGNISA